MVGSSDGSLTPYWVSQNVGASWINDRCPRHGQRAEDRATVVFPRFVLTDAVTARVGSPEHEQSELTIVDWLLRQWSGVLPLAKLVVERRWKTGERKRIVTSSP